MKENLLIIMVIALLFIGFIATGINYTGESYRTAVLSREAKFQDSRNVGNRYYPIYRGGRFPYHTSPGGTGISFLSGPPPGKGDLDGDGDVDKNDFRIVSAMYSRTKDIPFALPADVGRFNLGSEYHGGSTLGYTESSIGYYLSEGDLDDDGIITHKDVMYMYYLVNPFLGIKTSTIEDWVRAVNCAEPGRKTCSNYPADDKIYRTYETISQSYIGTCIELLPGSGVSKLLAYDYEPCPIGTVCVPTYDVVSDKFGRRNELRGAECRAQVPRQEVSLKSR